MDKIKVEVLTRTMYYGIVLREGELVDVNIKSDGTATVVGKPFIKLKPEQYSIHIDDKEYEKLLGGLT